MQISKAQQRKFVYMKNKSEKYKKFECMDRNERKRLLHYEWTRWLRELMRKRLAVSFSIGD